VVKAAQCISLDLSVNLEIDTRHERRVEEQRLGGGEDERAIREFLEGDRDGFDRLVLKYRAQVYGLCYRFTGNHHDADDQVQEVFLRAYRGLPNFRGQAKFSTWLYRIAVNTCLNWASTRKSYSEPLPEELADPSPGQAEKLSHEQLGAEIREAVARLPEKQKATLMLRLFHGLSHREIAEVMESPIGTVKANYFFALQNLRKALSGTGLMTDD
jgi:RNA polymerase sigma-70 factor (ECF subfamily)